MKTYLLFVFLIGNALAFTTTSRKPANTKGPLDVFMKKVGFGLYKLDRKICDAQDHIEELKEVLKVHDEQLAALETGQDEQNSRLNALEDKDMVLMTDISDLQDKDMVLMTDISDLKDKDMVLMTDISDLQDKDMVLMTDISDLQAKDMVLMTDISNLEDIQDGLIDIAGEHSEEIIDLQNNCCDEGDARLTALENNCCDEGDARLTALEMNCCDEGDARLTTLEAKQGDLCEFMDAVKQILPDQCFNHHLFTDAIRKYDTTPPTNPAGGLLCDYVFSADENTFEIVGTGKTVDSSISTVDSSIVTVGTTTRTKTMRYVVQFQGDGWYKFEGGAGSRMFDNTDPVPSKYRCGTHAPGWMDDTHPDFLETKDVEYCFHWAGNVCKWSKFGKVTNCGSFYVYYLVNAPGCPMAYCGTDLPLL